MAGRNEFTRPIPQPWTRCHPVGWSKDCICTSSSLTTPPTPSLITCETTGRANRGWEGWYSRPAPRPVIPPQSWTATDPRETGEDRSVATAAIPARWVAMASISSMNPIAAPSARAALRSSLKKDLIFRAVAP